MKNSIKELEDKLEKISLRLNQRQREGEREEKREGENRRKLVRKLGDQLMRPNIQTGNSRNGENKGKIIKEITQENFPELKGMVPDRKGH